MKILEKALQIADSFGLHTGNWENHLGIVELLPEIERKLLK
ncbi:MAG: M20 family metallopeptidase [Dorea sp.]|nr:M20 family metallopeptidase [Dorea sp.]